MMNFVRRRNLLAGLTAVLLLTSSMTPVTVAVAQAATADPTSTREWKAYADSAYGYCDADVLSKLWKVGIDEAKIRLGRKILMNDQRTLDQMLGQAYTRDGCEQGFNFEDAPTVAELWTAATSA